MVIEQSSISKPFNSHPSIPLLPSVQTAIQRSHHYFLTTQKSSGYWHFLLEADSTLVADYVFLTHYIGRVDPVLEKKSIRRLMDTQLEDGGWNIYHGGPSEINATVKCAFAMQLAGMTMADEALRRAVECLLRLGGLDAVNSYTRFYLGLFGQYPWNKLVSIPPELMFLPTSFYFNIYEISSWSRAILVPMSIIWAHRPLKTPPPTVNCSGWWCANSRRTQARHLKEAFSWKTFFLTFDAILRHSNRFYAPFTRREALRRAEQWLLEHISRGGGLGAIYPAMMNAILALDCLGYSLDHPVYENALDEFMKLMVEKEESLSFQPCFSPVWDTAIATAALERSGMPSEHPAIQKASEWLINQEITIRGDWQIKNPYGPTSGWAFEFENDFYPDTDDTAMVLMALQGSELSGQERKRTVVKRGLDWLLTMQSSDGGWGAFDVDINKEILNMIPFADHNALLDPSSADVTGRMLEMFAQFGYDHTFSPASRAIAFMKTKQEKDGCWYGRWGVNYVYGTWQAITGLVQIGMPASEPCIQRGAEWLIEHQNPDGGWGESCKTYNHANLRGQGPSTPSQTSWGVMGLLHAGLVDHPAVEKGIQYLIEHQHEDGYWDEEEFTGTGFPRVFYLRYTGYRQYFPMMALGVYEKLSQSK